MANKLKDAFRKAGIGLPAKQKNTVVKESKHKQRSTNLIDSNLRKTDQSVRNKQSNKKFSRSNCGEKACKKTNPKQKIQTMFLYDRLPSSAAILNAYGSSSKGKSENNRARSQTPERTILKTREGSHFNKNPMFNQKGGDKHITIINESPCVTQISPGSEIEVQLVIGLDLGTSMTKVIIGDPDQKRFYAVPISSITDNPYLISTSIIKDEINNIIIDTGGSSKALHNIKMDLMETRTTEAIIHLAGYVAQIIRHSMRWFISAHADAYRGTHLFWTMAMGLPVDSVRQPELESRFRIAAITGAQAAISQESINVANLGVLVKQVEEDMLNQEENGVPSCFEELGGDPGVVVVVPEIAAQVIGLYRSRRWERNRPISFLMDVGGSTVDSAVFSLVGAMQEGKELAFCAFTCNVSELGVTKLHQDRIDWLQENLPEDLPEREEVVAFLANLKRSNEASITVPGNIDDYINHVEIVRGTSNIDPDRRFKCQLGYNVYHGVLGGAKRKNERDNAWSSLRTMICGGGARSAFYQEYIQGLSIDSCFNLQLEVLEKPLNLDAPGLPSTEYDRLSVAYGLAQGTQWEYRWPESIEENPYTRKDPIEGFISKDMV